MQTFITDVFLKLQALFLGPASWLDGFFEGPARDNLDVILDTSEFSNPINGLYLILNKTGISTDSIYLTLWESVQKLITKTIMPIGVALVTTYFIMTLIDMASRDNTTLEHYIKEFIKLIVAVTIVTKSWSIILYLLKVSEFVLNDIGKIISSFPLKVTVDEILNHHTGGYVALWFTSLLPWLVKKISVLALYVCVFLRALDVSWRAALFPIGAANLFEGGISSPGVRYIKAFFGALLAGAMMMVILAVSPSLLMSAYNIAGGASNAPTGMLAIAGAELAIVGAAFGASGKVKEVFS